MNLNSDMPKDYYECFAQWHQKFSYPSYENRMLLTAPAQKGEVICFSDADMFILPEEGVFILCDKTPDQADVLMH